MLFLRPCRCRPVSTVGGVGVSGLLPLSLKVVGTGISHIEAGGPLAVACLVVPAVPVANVGIPD